MRRCGFGRRLMSGTFNIEASGPCCARCGRSRVHIFTCMHWLQQGSVQRCLHVLLFTCSPVYRCTPFGNSQMLSAPPWYAVGGLNVLRLQKKETFKICILKSFATRGTYIWPTPEDHSRSSAAGAHLTKQPDPEDPTMVLND